MREQDVHLTPWTRTDPSAGNRYRILAKGARVYMFPLFLYCDDTSGNSSKKWNKHNSFLFTAAGLPRAELHKEHNIHFLCTSNIAPPLEMLEGIVEQLEYGASFLFTHIRSYSAFQNRSHQTNPKPKTNISL